MKKLFVFLILLGCLCSTFAFKNQKNPIFDAKNVEKVCFVDEKSYDDDFFVESVQCGDMFFNFCSLDEAKKHIDQLKTFKAMQFYFVSTPAADILESLKAKIVSTERVENIEIINAYTPYFDKSVVVQGKKVNLQLAAKDGDIVAGFPMILTGF